MQRQQTDEWPNLSAIDEGRPRFPNGDPIGPLLKQESQRSAVSVLVFALILLWLTGAFIKACNEVTSQPDAAVAR